MSANQEWYPSVASLAEMAAAMEDKPIVVDVVVAPLRFPCVDSDDYQRVLTTHDWTGQPLLPVSHKRVRESHCRKCKARLTLVWRDGDRGPLPAVAEFYNNMLTHRAWQKVGGEMESVSHRTFVAVWQADLRNSLLRYGVRPQSERPAEPVLAPAVCEHETAALPASDYETIEQHHDMEARFGNIRRYSGLAGVFTTVACHRCNARKVVLSRTHDPERPIAAALIRYWGSDYGHAWQSIAGVMEPTALDTVASILRGLTTAERLAQTRAGIVPQFRKSILQPRFSTAVDDWTVAIQSNPR